MSSLDALASLEELGSTQWGLVSTAQAARVGVNRVTLGRLADRGVLNRLRHGVYALPSSEYGPLQALRAAWVAIDPRRLVDERIDVHEDAVVSHFSAAVVHGLGDVVAPKHEFTSTIRRQSSQFDIRFHKSDVETNERTLIDGLPVTSIVRTVGDLAAARLDFDHLASVVRDALGHVSVEELAQSLMDAAPSYGCEGGQGLIDACVDKAGLPEPVTRALKNHGRILAKYLNPELEKQLPASNLAETLSRQSAALIVESFQNVFGAARPEIDSHRSAELDGDDGGDGHGEDARG